MNKVSRRNTILGIMTHVIVLSIVFILPEVIFTAAMGQKAKFGPRHFDIYIHTIAYIITFYVNYFILIDKLLFKKKTWTYFIVAAIFAAIMVTMSSCSHQVIDHFVEHVHPPRRHGGEEHQGFFMLSLMTRDYVMLLLTIGLSIALKMGLRWSKIEKMNERIISERKDMELRNLKNQLNPHFLFNTLNNIYALTAIDTDKAQDAIHQLSKLLRYALYENDSHEVTLEKELLFIRSYINLMALRLSENTKLLVDIRENVADGITIAPMMFISLIENAFKHGVSATAKSFIDIRINVDGSKVCCHVENSLFPKKDSDKSGSGIGLTNLRRQLDLLYPNRYTYSAEIVSDHYVAELTIDTKEQ